MCGSTRNALFMLWSSRSVVATTGTRNPSAQETRSGIGSPPSVISLLWSATSLRARVDQSHRTAPAGRSEEQ
jgi:hypothetical protein